MRTIIPIVFCPSFAPWVSASQADDMIDNLPNVLFTTAGLRLAKTAIIIPTKTIPKIIPPIGAIIIPAKTLVSPP